MVFKVKQDGRQKARLVAGGHIVDPMGIISRSTVVKGFCVRLLDLIAHRDNLPILCGDIGNAFITANCLEKIYSRVGPEFEDREGSVIIFKKALYYGLGRRVAHFGHTLRIAYARWVFSDALLPRCLDASTRGGRWVRLHLYPRRRLQDRGTQPGSMEITHLSGVPIHIHWNPSYYLGKDYNFG